ncbi:MAG: tyrosine-type recombinase/integrase [Lachnospiraceae bacterium]|nr:tyrosine-type recombinase/integrase [Lachnospiraceae bacterium]
MFNEDVLKEFIFHCRMKKYSERTLKGYKNNNLALFRFIKNEYGIATLEDTHYQAVQGYIQFLTDKHLTETYINGLIKCFRAYFRYCHEEGYIQRNPMDKIKFQKEPLTLINTFTNAEVLRMVQFYNGKRFLDIRNKLIMVLLFDTGMRNTELCSLREIDLRETYISILGKGRKERHVPITPIMNKVLIQYQRVKNEYIKDKLGYETEYLLLSQKGRKLTVETVERIVLEAGLNVGVRPCVRISPHTCRHYYAQTQLYNGCDLFSLSRLLGHSNINITKTYLQSMHEDNFLELAIKTSPLANL